MCSNMDRASETNTNFVQTNKNREMFTLKLRNSPFDLFNKGEEKLRSNALQVPCVFF